jgi:hypothetical protein
LDFVLRSGDISRLRLERGGDGDGKRSLGTLVLRRSGVVVLAFRLVTRMDESDDSSPSSLSSDD